MNRQLLVVEDEPCISELVALTLEDAGYTVATAPDGQAALGKLAAADYDLVLSDVMLPHLDGPGLVAAMRRNAALRAIPVVLMSAAPPRHLGDVPHAAFVQKPFDLDCMVATVGAVLAGGR